jgi:hypothetical protein
VKKAYIRDLWPLEHNISLIKRKNLTITSVRSENWMMKIALKEKIEINKR